MVLFYENTPAELYECTRKELVKRLYKVTAMAAEGRVQFLFHQEARDQKTLTSLYGAGTSQFCQSNPSPKCASAFPILTCWWKVMISN